MKGASFGNRVAKVVVSPQITSGALVSTPGSSVAKSKVPATSRIVAAIRGSTDPLHRAQIARMVAGTSSVIPMLTNSSDTFNDQTQPTTSIAAPAIHASGTGTCARDRDLVAEASIVTTAITRNGRMTPIR